MSAQRRGWKEACHSLHTRAQQARLFVVRKCPMRVLISGRSRGCADRGGCVIALVIVADGGGSSWW
jgi:hypothetical protein